MAVVLLARVTDSTLQVMDPIRVDSPVPASFYPRRLSRVFTCDGLVIYEILVVPWRVRFEFFFRIHSYVASKPRHFRPVIAKTRDVGEIGSDRKKSSGRRI